jgi:steroid delta-isomerase-like uncharacterized protein
MSAEDNKKLVLEHYEAFLNRRDDNAVSNQLTADFVDHEMPPGTPVGPGGALQYRSMLLAAFPDLRVKVEDIVAEGDRVAVRAVWTGTHRGSFTAMPLPPTNRTAQLSGMVFWRIRDGKLAERWATLDRMGLYQQLTAK